MQQQQRHEFKFNRDSDDDLGVTSDEIDHIMDDLRNSPDRRHRLLLLNAGVLKLNDLFDTRQPDDGILTRNILWANGSQAITLHL